MKEPGLSGAARAQRRAAAGEHRRT